MKSLPYTKRLEFKFLSVFLSLTLLVCIILFGVFEAILLHRDFQKMEEKKKLVAEHFVEVADEWLWNLDREHIKKSFELQMEDPVVSGIRVLDEEEEIFAETDKFGELERVSTLEKSIYFKTDASLEYIGKVIVAVSDEPLIAQSKERLLRNGLLVLLIGITAFVGAIFVNRRIVTKPLYRFISEIEQNGTDQFPQKIEWHSDDEIGILISSFNRMMDRRLRAIEAKEKMAQDLQQAQKLEAVGQLAGGIAHEINTPSQYIGDNLRFLQDSEEDLFRIYALGLKLKKACENGNKTQDIVHEMNTTIEEIDLEFLLEEVPLAINQSLSGIQQISKIVLAMKEFSHPGAKEKTPVDINHAIQTTLTVSQNEWKNVATIKQELDNNLGNVPCLPAEMNQVFLNLIVNAAHALEDADKGSQGYIQISTQALAETIEIRIEDNANGIPEEIQEMVFNPFFTTKEVGRGTGQGLSIARDIIVNKHGGSLDFQTKQGKGTTFIISLPAK